MSKQYTSEQQELFTKVGNTFNRLNMDGQDDTTEKVNFRKGELSMMKKDGKVLVEHKSVMKHFANYSSLEKFLEDNLEYYMNKIDGKIAKASIDILSSNGVEVKNGQIRKDQQVKAANILRNDKIQKAEATIRVDVDEKYKEYFNSIDKMKESFKFFESAEKELGCPIEWDCDAGCFWIHDDDVACDPEKLKKMLPKV